MFHGAVVLLVGLLSGVPYGRAINRSAPAHVVDSLRVAHSSLAIGALLMFAVAALLANLKVAAADKWAIAGMLIVSSYAFCLSLPLAALVGHRGLSPRGPLLAKLVFAGNMLGAGASLFATLLFLCAAYVSL